MDRIRLKRRGGASAACVAALAYLFLVTAFLSGFAQGAMANPGGEPWQVICSAGVGQPGEAGADSDGSEGAGITCPLCALSRIATAAMAPADTAPSLDGRAPPVRSVRSEPHESVASALLRILTTSPRAPPVS